MVFVQLMGRSNYGRYSPRLIPAVDLVAHPDLANSSDAAAALLALFLKHHDLTIKDALLHGDFRTARRSINGGSHGADVFAEAYQVGDFLLG